MIRTQTTNGITIAFADIPEGSRNDRRQRERTTIEHMLAILLGSSVILRHTDDGAPFIDGAEHMHISISHSQTQAAVAISHNIPIGIDTETMRPQLERVKDKYLSPAEQTEWNTLILKLTAWCIKEAAYKAYGIPGIDFVNDIKIDLNGNVNVAGKTFTYTIVEQTPTQVTVLVALQQ